MMHGFGGLSGGLVVVWCEFGFELQVKCLEWLRVGDCAGLVVGLDLLKPWLRFGVVFG
jgi:hypothetical protein